MLRCDIDEYVNDFFPDSSVDLLDGHDDALIGIGRDGNGVPRPVYDIRKILDKLGETLSPSEAWDFFENKIEGNPDRDVVCLFIF